VLCIANVNTATVLAFFGGKGKTRFENAPEFSRAARCDAGKMAQLDASMFDFRSAVMYIMRKVSCVALENTTQLHNAAFLSAAAPRSLDRSLNRQRRYQHDTHKLLMQMPATLANVQCQTQPHCLGTPTFIIHEFSAASFCADAALPTRASVPYS
jgi:hypothetical protein